MDYKFLEIAKFIWNKLSSESQSCLTLCDPWNSPGQNTGVSSHSLLQGIFPTQRSNPGLPHCRQILYQLGHKGSPRILEWVAYPSPVDLPDPGIEPGSPALKADSVPAELSGESPNIRELQPNVNFLRFRLSCS